MKLLGRVNGRDYVIIYKSRNFMKLLGDYIGVEYSVASTRVEIL